MKKKFRVTVMEVYAKPVIIEAETAAEAEELVRGGDGDYDAEEGDYSHTLDAMKVAEVDGANAN